MKLNTSVKRTGKLGKSLTIGNSSLAIKAKKEGYITKNAKGIIPLLQAFYISIIYW